MARREAGRRSSCNPLVSGNRWRVRGRARCRYPPRTDWERVDRLLATLLYTATISSTPLRLRETRIIADLLLQGVTGAGWKDAVLEQNVLQMSSTVATVRSSNIIRARIEPLGE